MLEDMHPVNNNKSNNSGASPTGQDSPGTGDGRYQHAHHLKNRLMMNSSSSSSLDDEHGHDELVESNGHSPSKMMAGDGGEEHAQMSNGDAMISTVPTATAAAAAMNENQLSKIKIEPREEDGDQEPGDGSKSFIEHHYQPHPQLLPISGLQSQADDPKGRW